MLGYVAVCSRQFTQVKHEVRELPDELSLVDSGWRCKGLWGDIALSIFHLFGAASMSQLQKLRCSGEGCAAVQTTIINRLS